MNDSACWQELYYYYCLDLSRSLGMCFTSPASFAHFCTVWEKVLSHTHFLPQQMGSRCKVRVILSEKTRQRTTDNGKLLLLLLSLLLLLYIWKLKFITYSCIKFHFVPNWEQLLQLQYKDQSDTVVEANSFFAPRIKRSVTKVWTKHRALWTLWQEVHAVITGLDEVNNIWRKMVPKNLLKGNWQANDDDDDDDDKLLTT